LKKIVVIINHAADEPELCLHSWILAVNASSAGLHPVVILQSNGVDLAKKGFAASIIEPEFPPLETLMESFISGGGRLLVSGPSLKRRTISNDELIEEVVVVSSGIIVREIQDAEHVVAY
jgi:predicted peroxiredoxin